MTNSIDIKSGDWVLGFHESFMYHEDSIEMAVERFQTRGCGWDWAPAHKLMYVVPAEVVKPKTFWGVDGERRWRCYVIAVLPDEASALALARRLHAIGEEASARVENEARRLLAPIEKRERAKALVKIRAALPHLFPSAAEGGPAA
ncbi:hypothetical protein [Georhizobium sp. MAB10]|uniref:hypothetical protein n=1 Tax=Georhizobium sp. MAB10 TaxID=3028319 RepID=UPI003855F56A